MASQLAAVVGGKTDIKNLSPKAVATALEDAASKLSRQQKALQTMKENAGTAAHQAVAALELHGTAFLASMASGFRGEKALKVGPVDLRLVGVPLVLWGFYDCLFGKGGSHQLALGNGLLVSLNVEQAMLLGHQIREMRAGTAASSSPASAPGGGVPPVALTPGPDESTEGESNIREILLHPADGQRRSHPPRPQHRPPGPRRQMAR